MTAIAEPSRNGVGGTIHQSHSIVEKLVRRGEHIAIGISMQDGASYLRIAIRLELIEARRETISRDPRKIVKKNPITIGRLY
ncbi:MAG: hypothetical protein AB7I48_24715 [Planctomycetaceae bacterium]